MNLLFDEQRRGVNRMLSPSDYCIDLLHLLVLYPLFEWEQDYHRLRRLRYDTQKLKEGKRCVHEL